MKESSDLTGKGISAAKIRQPLRFRSVALVGATLVLSGCSTLNIGEGDYSCPGMPSGVQCMSARDVYAATNDGNVPRPMRSEQAQPEEGVLASSRVPTSSTSSGDVVIDNYVTPRLPDRPVPIRTPAQVMRIWVAPWEDTNGDLIVSGYVYTEIEPRRWVIGDGAPRSEPVLRPLQTVRQESKAVTSK